MAEIKVKAVASSLPQVGAQQLYRLVPTSTKTVTEAEFIALLAAEAKQGETEARFWADNYRDVLFKQLMLNNAVDLGFAYAKLYVRGSLKSASDQPTKKENPVVANITIKGSLAELMKSLEVINDTMTVDVFIYELMQDGADAPGTLDTPNARVVINAKNCRIDPSRADEGVWLEKADGTVAAVGEVTYSDSSTVYAKFATLPETGVYTLVLATRNGESADAYAVARATRRGQVVLG